MILILLDYIRVKDWFEQVNVHHVSLTVKYLINPKTCELYTTKDITLIKHNGSIYFECKKIFIE